MKKILLALFVLPIIGYSQVDSTAFQFTKIDSVKGSKAYLFVNAKSWLASTFNSSKAVIEMEDKDAGVIIGHGTFVKRENSAFGNQVGLSLISFSIKINLKDNKYRCILSNFNHKYVQTASTFNPNQSYAMNNLTSSLTSNESGGSLDDEKPDCGGMFMTRKQWQKIKDYATSESERLLSSMNKAMTTNTNDNF